MSRKTRTEKEPHSVKKMLLRLVIIQTVKIAIWRLIAEAVSRNARSIARDDDNERLLAEFDTTSSASRQHYIDTGRYLRHGEAVHA